MEPNSGKETHLTAAKKDAWIAYYVTLRDHPSATAEEKDRANRMLHVGEKLDIVAKKEPEPDDFV